MRKDMLKVIVERPHQAAGFRVNRARLSGEIDIPSRVGVQPHGYVPRFDTVSGMHVN